MGAAPAELSGPRAAPPAGRAPSSCESFDDGAGAKHGLRPADAGPSLASDSTRNASTASGVGAEESGAAGVLSIASQPRLARPALSVSRSATGASPTSGQRYFTSWHRESAICQSVGIVPAASSDCREARASSRRCNRGGAADVPSSGSSCGAADGTAESVPAPWSGSVGAARCGAAGGGGASGGREGGGVADGPRSCSSFCLFSITGLGRSWSASEAISLIRLPSAAVGTLTPSRRLPPCPLGTSTPWRNRSTQT